MDGQEEPGVNIWVAYADLFLGLLVVMVALFGAYAVTPELMDQVRRLGPMAALEILKNKERPEEGQVMVTVRKELAELVKKMGEPEALRILGQRAEITRTREQANQIMRDLAKALGVDLPTEHGAVMAAPNEIRLPERTLFRSGGYDDFLHDEKAKQALLRVGNELRRKLDDLPAVTRKLVIMIEGHTDDEPIRARSELARLFPTNWELSSRRATEVVRFWERESGLEPGRYKIVAVGFGDQRPVPGVYGRTKEEKEPHRRIEIRIIPDYEELEKGP